MEHTSKNSLLKVSIIIVVRFLQLKYFAKSTSTLNQSYLSEKILKRAWKGRTDEMCNLYLMYATPFRDEPLKAMSCWGYRVEDVESDYFNQLDVNDLTPYPGYAGAVSEKAINSGKWAMPLVPDEMVGGMGG